MRKSLILLVAAISILFVTFSVSADPTLTFQWDPPTHKLNSDNCGDHGESITDQEVTQIHYLFEYRVVGTEEYTSTETSAPTTIVENLLWNTAYEFRVSANLAGGPYSCYTDPVVYTTTIPPGVGKCSNVRIAE